MSVNDRSVCARINVLSRYILSNRYIEVKNMDSARINRECNRKDGEGKISKIGGVTKHLKDMFCDALHSFRNSTYTIKMYTTVTHNR